MKATAPSVQCEEQGKVYSFYEILPVEPRSHYMLVGLWWRMRKDLSDHSACNVLLYQYSSWKKTGDYACTTAIPYLHIQHKYNHKFLFHNSFLILSSTEDTDKLPADDKLFRWACDNYVVASGENFKVLWYGRKWELNKWTFRSLTISLYPSSAP